MGVDSHVGVHPLNYSLHKMIVHSVEEHKLSC